MVGTAAIPPGCGAVASLIPSVDGARGHLM